MLLENLMSTYTQGNQIDFDELLILHRGKDTTLADTASYILEGMQKTLYYIWPRARELGYVLDITIVTLS